MTETEASTRDMRVQTTVTASGEADRAGDRKGDGTEEGPSESLSALTGRVFSLAEGSLWAVHPGASARRRGGLKAQDPSALPA